nr:hypothetical protein [Actinomycetota bacterium]
MAQAPGITFQSLSTPPPGPAGPRTATAFLTAQVARGPIGAPIPIQSITDFVAKLGGRQPYSPLYDSLDLMFRDGLAQAYVSRVAGPGAAPATIMLKDTTPVTPVNTLAVTANSPGAWGN